MEKRSTIKQIFVSLGLFLVLWFVFQVLFDILEQSIFGEYEDEMYTHPLVVIFATLFSLFIVCVEYVVSKVNYVEKVRNNAENIKNSINMYINKQNRLYKKATELINRYLSHEHDTHVQVAENRTPATVKGDISEVKSISQFKGVVESYPTLKANETLDKMLKQLEKTEDEVLEIKQIYNNNVSLYNDAIISFALRVFKNYQRMDYYSETIEDELDFDL